jgi:uncharacterized protein YmfQ (DUF2313 family)
MAEPVGPQKSAGADKQAARVAWVQDQAGRMMAVPPTSGDLLAVLERLVGVQEAMVAALERLEAAVAGRG